MGQHIANHVDPEEIEAHLLFAYENPGPVAAASSVQCHFPKVEGRYDLEGWIRARRLLQRIDPDILHFQDPLTTLRFFLIGHSTKTLKHCHGRPGFPKSLLEKGKRQWRRLITDRFVCIDPVAARTLVDYGLADESQCVVVPNAVDVDHLQNAPSQEKAREELGLPQGGTIIGMVGRIIEDKGFPDLFEVLKKLPRSYHALIAGDGGEREEMEHRAQKRGVRSRIHFLGSLGDVRPAYAAMDIYLFLSLDEAFGLVLAEAMASEVPIFGLHGMGEYTEIEPPLITDKVATFFERENPDRFRDVSERGKPEPDYVIQKVSSAIRSFDPESPEAKEQVQAAKEHVRSHFDVSIQAQRMTNIYQNLLNDTAD